MKVRKLLMLKDLWENLETNKTLVSILINHQVLRNLTANNFDYYLTDARFKKTSSVSDSF